MENMIDSVKSPLSDEENSRIRNEFENNRSSGTLANTDLYWVLYQAAAENPSSNNSFYTEVHRLISTRLGGVPFCLGITLRASKGAGVHGNTASTTHPNVRSWIGDAGVLPGVGGHQAIACFVFW